MPLRPARETIAALRRTLQQVEANLHPTFDRHAFHELQRIVLQRIAQLELQAPSETMPEQLNELAPKATAT